MNLIIAILAIFYMLYIMIKDISKREMAIYDFVLSFILLLAITNFGLVYVVITVIYLILEFLYRKKEKTFFNFGYQDLVFLEIMFFLSLKLFLSLVIDNMSKFFITSILSIVVTIVVFIVFKVIKYKSQKNEIPFLLYIIPFNILSIITIVLQKN